MNMFAARALTGQINIIHPVGNFLTKTFFNDEKHSDTKYVDIVITKGGKEIAPHVSPRIAGKIQKKNGKKLETYEPPLLKPKFVTEAEEALEGSTVFYANGASPAERAAQILIDDLDDGKSRIERSKELMVANALIDGKIIVKGDGVEDEIDFGRNGSNTKVLTGTALWSHVDSDPRSDLKAWKQELFDRSGVVPTEVVFGQDVGNAYTSHAKVQAAFDKKNIFLGEYRPENIEPGVDFIGYDRELNLNIYKYVAKYADPITKNDTPYLAADKLILGAKRESTGAHVAFGGISDFKAFKKEGMGVNLFVGTIFVKSYEENDPSVRFLVFQSKPLPIPGNVDATMSAKVV